MNSQLSLHPVGLTPEEHKILSVTMSVLEASGCGVQLADQVSGETVIVIDVDSEEGRAFYELDHCAHRAVVIAGDERSYRADALIRKPLRVQTLRNMLTDMAESGVDSTAAAPSSAAASTSPALSPQLANSSLFHIMVNAAAGSTMLKVAGAMLPHPVLIHGPSRHLYTRLDREQLAQLAEMGASQLEVTPMEMMAFMKESQGIGAHRFDKILWLAEAKGAKGSAPTMAGERTTFRLSQWPRFDIRSVKPEYLSLSALLSRNTLSCAAAAQMAGLSLATVFNFYHAALACGVVETFAPPEQSMPEPAVQPIKRSSLVSRIAQKLGISLV